MTMRVVLAVLLLMPAGSVCGAEGQSPPADAGQELEVRIDELVRQLGASKTADREAAEKQLLDIAGTEPDEAEFFLKSLPKDNDDMPLVVRDRLGRIRRLIEERASQVSTGASKVTLSAKNMPLADVFKELEKQTGNKIVDGREEPDEDAKGPTITIELKDELFWSAMDKILDQANLSINSFGGEEALSVVARGENGAARVGRADYEGPLRFEALEVQAQRNLRQPDQTSLRLQLEIGWEPRMRPILISQPLGEVEATTDGGDKLTVSEPEAMQDIEVAAGTQAAEIVLPFNLPGRDVKKIASLRGKLHALVPGRRAKFEFSDLTKAAGKSQSLGGVQVTIDQVRKNNAIWEIHMRIALEGANEQLEANRGWILQNLSYLTDKSGERIENAGFETTRQSQKEVGIAYLFDVAEGLEGLTWVYESPAAIVEVPIDYELTDIELP
jgi:hypothetical protein